MSFDVRGHVKPGGPQYAGFRAPHHPDLTTTGGPGRFFLSDARGNVVNRRLIPKTIDSAGGKTAVFPAGEPLGEGY